MAYSTKTHDEDDDDDDDNNNNNLVTCWPNSTRVITFLFSYLTNTKL